MADCIFCKIAAGDIPAARVYEDEHCIAFRDLYPKAPVHVLLIPRAHIAGLDALTSGHDALMAHMLRCLPQIARALGLAEGFRTIVNTGRGGGQEVFHLHFHLLGGDRLPGL